VLPVPKDAFWFPTPTKSKVTSIISLLSIYALLNIAGDRNVEIMMASVTGMQDPNPSEFR
jgi:hypothetical protein